MLPSSGHHSKQRPPSPASRDEEKRRTQDDKWKGDNPDKQLRDRVHTTGRGQAFDESTYETLSNKHSLSSRLLKSSRAPSLDYVRLKNPPEPPEPSLLKKKSKDKIEDKVSYSIQLDSILVFHTINSISCVLFSFRCVAASKSEN